MEAVVLSSRFVHRISVPTLWICFIVLFGSLKESNARFTFVEEPQDTAVVLGDPVSLNCTGKDSIKIKYYWQFKGSKIVTDSRVIVQSDGTLHITNAGKADSGDYVCVAVTKPGGVRTKSKSRKAILTVQSICSASSIVKTPDSTPYAAGKDLKLACRCSGTPRLTVVWHNNGIPVIIGGRFSASGSSLSISKLETKDSGNYECTATNNLGSKKSPAANIQVIKAVEPKFDEEPKDEFVKLGQDLTLMCKASGRPKPSITWFYSTLTDALVNSSKHTISSDGSLGISNVDFSDFGVYKCQAKNIVNSLSATAQVSEAFIRDLSFSPAVIYTEVGQKFSLICKPDGGPTPHITWQATGGGPLTASYKNNDGLLENNKVKITDSGNFTCIAKNVAGTRSAKVKVIASVFPTITTQPKDTLANENAKVKLDCTVDSSPPARVTWSVNGHGVKLDSNHKINSNNALVFKKISLGDAGFYRCIVNHPGKTVISQEANVTVLDSVRLADYLINHHKFDKGSTAKLYCSFKGSGPISVKWKKIGTMSMSKRVVSKDGTLTINDIDMEDEGIYTCIGSNLFSNVSARINISVFIYPKFIVKPKNTTAVEFDSVWLHCNATGYPKPKINWGKEEHGGDVLDEERFHVLKNGTLYIENVRAKDQGRYYCIAGNIANFKQVTISLRVVIDPADVQANTKASAMGRTIAIAVGCAAAYIVLVVGLMVYCKRRRAKQQKKEELTLPIDGDLDNCEANPEIALQPINGKPANYNKMEFPRHDLEALRTLGNGSYGRAFLARASGIKDGERETMVVVKSLMSKDDIQKEDFWRELNALVNMDNPHVVALLGVCRDIDPTYMIFESLEKGDLKQYLLSCYDNGRSTLTSSQKLSLCSNIVSGMTYLASNKFVHKDVAARNCMVTKDLQVKIGFLSLSYDLYNSEYYRFNNILIPLRWMAAEAIFNDEFTEMSDVWSFGVLVWEVYTLGQTPFEERSDEEVLKCIKDDLRLSKPDNCPDSMANIMVKCWEESPDSRPTFDKLYAEISEIAVDTHL